MQDPESPNLQLSSDYISRAIFYIGQAIDEQNDNMRAYELSLALESLQRSQKLIQYGLM